MKGCGKSAPRFWQQNWQGKPHPEQDQIGMTYDEPFRCHPGRSRDDVGNNIAR